LVAIDASLYLNDLAEAWERDGKQALRMVAATDPAAFIKVVASLVPKEAMLTTVSVDASLKVATDAAQAFALLRSLPRAELIELQKNDPAE
jgi:hypothetical protein